MDAIVDRFLVDRKHKAIKAGIAGTLLVGDGLLQAHIVKGISKAEAERFYGGLCSATHHLVHGDIGPAYFVFNDPDTVILIEHHLDVIKTADHVIDLGPDGGHAGGAGDRRWHAGSRRGVPCVAHGAVPQSSPGEQTLESRSQRFPHPSGINV